MPREMFTLLATLPLLSTSGASRTSTTRVLPLFIISRACTGVMRGTTALAASIICLTLVAIYFSRSRSRPIFANGKILLDGGSRKVVVSTSPERASEPAALAQFSDNKCQVCSIWGCIKVRRGSGVTSTLAKNEPATAHQSAVERPDDSQTARAEYEVDNPLEDAA